jgi:hypothetical protein
MQPITTEKYVISLRGGRITCRYRQEPHVRITTIGQQGMQSEQKPFGEVFRAEVLPLFTATYSPKDGEFDVDLDCGAQRWTGVQSAAAVRNALVKCGMAKDIAKKIVAEAIRAGRNG